MAHAVHASKGKTMEEDGSPWSPTEPSTKLSSLPPVLTSASTSMAQTVKSPLLEF